MKWRVRKPGTKIRALHRWHVWFAWYPVRVPTKGKGSGQKMIWLEPVCRRGEFICGWKESAWRWAYKEVVIK